MRKGFTLIELPVVRKRGFTLIELLVVISIIALLLALLLPALGKARYSAQLSECAQNLQQIGVGVYSHAADQNGDYPRREANYVARPRKRTLAQFNGGSMVDDRPLLADYFTLDLMQCPFASFPSASTLAQSTATDIHGSYEMYFGSPINLNDERSYMLNVDDRVVTRDLNTGQDFEVNILAADTDWYYQLSINKWITSHPDISGNRVLQEIRIDDARRADYHWGSYTGTRGNIDRNLLYRDGSVQTLGNIGPNAPGLARIPADSRQPNLAIYHYLPLD